MILQAAPGRLKRSQSEYNPEDVMLHSGLEVGLTAAFLHENMLHFFGNDAVEDAAVACDYLVDVGEHSGPPLIFTACLRVGLIVPSVCICSGDCTKAGWLGRFVKGD